MWRGAPRVEGPRAHAGEPLRTNTTRAVASHKQALAGRHLRAEMLKRSVDLIGGALDEAPEAYKPIGEVMRYQDHLVEAFAEFHPFLVRMAND